MRAFCSVLALVALVGAQPNNSLRSIVDGVVRPMMAKDGIPGVAVAIADGGDVYEFDYGVASTKTHQPVTPDTLFEIGSITKTFTATLASLAQTEHRLSLADETATYLPALRGTPFGKVTLLDLGTHTPGGLPLQVPAGITNEAQLIRYLRKWQPAYKPGTVRTYNNPGIGMLGVITAKSMGGDFGVLIAALFTALGMKNSFIDVPAAKMAGYAEGYSSQGAPIRMKPGVLWAQAYGVRSTASDILWFVEANMGLIPLPSTLHRAITQTHTGYFIAGPMTQDLVWEQYPYPVKLKTLVQGNSPHTLFDPTPVTELKPPQTPRNDVWINKTGSTNGFGAYAAFVPSQRFGIVILANKSFPIADRVSVAYDIASVILRRTH